MKSQVGFGLIGAARLLAARQQWEDAAVLHRAAEAILDETGLALFGTDKQLSDQLVADAEAALGTQPFQMASARGRALDAPSASALAFELLGAYVAAANSSG